MESETPSEPSTFAMAKAAVKAYEKIDVLINNAAVFATISISRVPFDEVSLEEWNEVMLVNLKGTWLCCRAVAPHMKEQGGGRIINISSDSIYTGRGMRIHDVTSKAGIVGFTRTLARELGEFGITVNSLSPGSALSEPPEDTKALAYRNRAIETRCLKRIQYPEDLVGGMIFLCSGESDFMTSQTVVVNGGDTML
jgi:3-oxoacyl-[acyl-carrier protein] reductase